MTIGHPVSRAEDAPLLRGEGHYTNDIAADDPVHMALFRSPEAAGRIVALDVSAARTVPGVLLVSTAHDLEDTREITPRLSHPGPDGGAMRVPPFPLLAREGVAYVGDPVALVLAETPQAAQDALEAIVLDIDPVAPVIGLAQAEANDRRVWDQFPDNRCFHVDRGDAGAVAQAIQGAAHVVRQRLDISRVTAVALEPRALRATFDEGLQSWRLDSGTQAPHRVAMDLAPLIGATADRIHVVSPDCGGSFGMKNAGYQEQALALWAAQQLPGKTVVWTATRLESFLSDSQARESVADATLALDAEGRFLALDVRIAAALGARLGPATTHPPVANLGGLSGVYRIPAIHASVDGYFTNTQYTAPYRGAGRPEATYIVERMIDIAAAELGIDRAELRRRNLIPARAMPYDTGFLFAYDSGDFPAVLDRALDLADWRSFGERRSASAAKGLLRGLGIAFPIEIAGGPAGKPHPEYARIALSPEGVELRAGSSDSGQGHATAYRQILAQCLGPETGPVSIVTGDSRAVARGTGTFGSRTLCSAGAAIRVSVDKAIAELAPQAAEMLEAAAQDVVFANGVFRVDGTDRALPLSTVLTERGTPVIAEVFDGPEGATFPNGCHVCEVEIDPETGAVALQSYVVVDDVGTVLNPMLVKGQIAGGVAQGLGQAFMERITYDAETGQMLTATLMDYALPRAADLPFLAVESLPFPTRANPLGVKGVGEAGTVGALSACMSAVNDALACEGVRHLDMPATPDRVWQALQAAKGN
ncbi:xanthine dehydrogenase family protein molybdopterin-binding subunit [Thetidibacter halocola]|uniref:Xanthine dehydrogenase family protein n=1 Tax=Thetidibacter halocola TaxID=2827239 RepID=A0A8J7WB78_9RHOB|nr:xanthine dehydrogenase family protein molybdopterin-binding subunit [Thetidibacter halocola]MBS0124327.1 xanthine dehydrogenase family protein [Thetidibacter halocola]